MKALLIGAGSRGDVQPMTVLAQGLMRAGHEVLLCGPDHFKHFAADLGVPYEIVGTDMQAYFAEHKEITSSPLKFVQHGTRVIRGEVDTQFDGLLKFVDGKDVIIAGGVVFAAQSVAEARRIPYVPIAYTPVMFKSEDHPPILASWTRAPKWLNRATWEMVEMLIKRFVGERLHARRSALGLSPVEKVFRSFEGNTPLVAADPELCPLSEGLKPRVSQTSALTWVTDDSLPGDVEEFLQAGPPPVYIGFGSMADPDATTTTRTILEAVRAAGTRAVISRGWAKLADGPLPDGVLAIGAVSHHALFKRMAAVVHHGGAGTTAAASRSGIPQVVVPHIADQFYFASRVFAVGASPPPLPRTQFNVKRLTQALKTCISDKQLQSRARALREALKPRRGVEDTVEWIERTVARGV